VKVATLRGCRDFLAEEEVAGAASRH